MISGRFRKAQLDTLSMPEKVRLCTDMTPLVASEHSLISIFDGAGVSCGVQKEDDTFDAWWCAACPHSYRILAAFQLS